MIADPFICSGSPRQHCLLVPTRLLLFDGGVATDMIAATVLAVIQEKLNNPSPEDPFMPDIAAVRASLGHRARPTLMLL